MSEVNITRLGINKVAIVDDELALNYCREELISAGIDEDVINAVSDDSSPSTAQLIDLLKSREIPYSSLQDRLNALGQDELRDSLPEYFLTDIVNVLEEHKKENQEKLGVIKSALIDLGLEASDIHEFSDTKGIDSDFDLIFLDLFLKEGNPDISISFLKDKLQSEGNNQFVLMSHDNTTLREKFEGLHMKHKATTTQLKLMPKAETADEAHKAIWKRAISLIAEERKLVGTQKAVLSDWQQVVEKASSSFLQKVWELDLFGLNKLRLTASADNMSLTEYMAEIMHKALLAEVQALGNTESKINSLELELENSEQAHLYNPSHEILDSYEKLTNLLADSQSLRSESLERFQKSSEEESDYRHFKSALKFGTVVKHTDSNKYWLHLTQPCDYIHIPLKQANQHCLFLFPGVSNLLFEDIQDGNKKVTTPFIRVENDVKNFRWNLRQLKSITIKDMFDDREKYSVVGEIRTDLAQAISHKFGSTVSRVAYLRTPWFGKISACLASYDNNKDTLILKSTKQELTINSKQSKIQKEAVKIEFHVYKETNSSNLSITLMPSSMKLLHEQTDEALNFTTEDLFKTIDINRNKTFNNGNYVFAFWDNVNQLDGDELSNLMESCKDKLCFLLLPPS